MTAPFPHHYHVELDRENGAEGELRAPPRRPLLVGPPPEFDGSDRCWSPEHLLLGAAASCLMSTFFALARRAGLEVEDYRCFGESTLEKQKEGLILTRIDLHVSLAVAPDRAAQALDLVRTAERHCLVAKSLKTPVHVEASILKEASPV